MILRIIAHLPQNLTGQCNMKIRAIVNGVSFYTTRADIKKRRVGDFLLQNDALAYALETMGKSIGIGTTVRYYDHKMVQHKFDIQLNRV
jgi:ABC-type sulfate/molybdate transport systems ATPase subunit